MVKLLLIGCGGFIGAIARYAVSGLVQNLSHSVSFPFGTLGVNAMGCFFIGALVYLVDAHGWLSVNMRLMLLIGFLGSFTTYSTFASETWNLFRDTEFLFAGLNMAVHLVLGLTAVWAGRTLAFLIWR